LSVTDLLYAIHEVTRADRPLPRLRVWRRIKDAEHEKRPSGAGDPGGDCSRPCFCPGAPVVRSGQLDQLVARIALYPDPLLAQVLAAATYPNDIPAAAQWADQHHYLTGQALANAISADQLPWDPSVQALLPFPSVLDMMNSDMNWTTQLGNAFLAQQQDVMDAVQRQRGHRATLRLPEEQRPDRGERRAVHYHHARESRLYCGSLL
jgi:hypothetical protein